MLKHLLLVAVLLNAIACSSEKHSSTPTTQPTQENTSSVTVENVPLSAATANVYEFMSGPQGPVSIHIYSEDGIWIIEQNVIAEDGLPTPMGRWTFTTKEKAYAYATEKLGINEAQRNDSALDKDPSSDVLFSDNLSIGSVLWDVTNTWSWEWEVAFAKWMRANLHPDFFEQLGIENDCADAYYQARMIFSYENALPVSFRLAGGGAYFTQNVVRPEWKKLKTDSDWRKNKRFLKALDYIANTTYTHTLGRDTYPVEISTEGLIEGTAFLYLDSTSGHTLLVNEINLGDSEASKVRLPMYTLNSTVPKSLQPLYEAMFYEPSQPTVSKYGFTGFVRFRWPKSSGAAALVDATKMPYYSMEQYDPSFMTTTEDSEPTDEETEAEYTNFSLTVFKKLNPDFDPTLRITEGITEVSEMMIARKDVVIEGYKVCQKGCADGSADYENWSTPSRDKRIKGLMVDLEKYQQALYSIPSVAKAWTNALEQPIVELEGTNYVLQHVKWTFANDFHSSDPNVTPGERWGLAPDAFALASAKQLNPMLEARNVKIQQKNDCSSSPTCLLFSEEYIQKGTYIEDKEMQNSIVLREEYCGIAGPALCEKFKATLATLPTAVPLHAHFLESWEKVFLLNSDPNVSEAQRWGAMPENVNTLTLSGAYTIVGKSANKLILYKDIYPNSELVVVDETTQKFEVLKKLPKSGTYALNSKESTLAIQDYAVNDVTIYDLKSMNFQVIKLNVTPSGDEYGNYGSITWLDQGQMIVTFQDKLFAYIRENDQYVTDGQEFTNYSQAGNNGYLYNVSNLEKDDSKPAQWEIQLINVIDATKPKIQIKVSDVIGAAKVSSYVSFNGLITDKAALFQWTRYEASDTVYGHIRIDLNTGKAVSITNLPSYISKFNGSIGTSTVYDDDGGGSTVFYFFNDDLDLEKKVTIPGYCQTCYEGSLDKLVMGSDIYKINITKKELVKTVSFSGLSTNESVDIGATYGNLAILTYSDSSNAYNVLFDLAKNEALFTAQTVGFSLMNEGIQPMLVVNKDYTVGDTEDNVKYYSFSALYDLYNPQAGPFATPGSYYYGDGGEEGGEDGAAFDAPDAGELFVPKAADVKLNATIFDSAAFSAKADKISVFNVSEYQTVIVFK